MIWTPERVNKLLLLIIKRHGLQKADYDWLAQERGTTRKSIEGKLHKLRHQDKGPTTGSFSKTGKKHGIEDNASSLGKATLVKSEPGSSSHVQNGRVTKGKSEA